MHINKTIILAVFFSLHNQTCFSHQYEQKVKSNPCVEADEQLIPTTELHIISVLKENDSERCTLMRCAHRYNCIILLVAREAPPNEHHRRLGVEYQMIQCVLTAGNRSAAAASCFQGRETKELVPLSSSGSGSKGLLWWKNGERESEREGGVCVSVKPI